ncbi:hypothetical protein [Photorhabdus sp. CRCIA-P01]|uniref:hypothetical protein n=1 Tax=Photorhabdus sp. CRCIA-P01 TaxID=2019570 RepID=UPI0013006CBD|nr:hypothetical protein [Photorhabdus sp. CRCIA-P01]
MALIKSPEAKVAIVHIDTVVGMTSYMGDYQCPYPDDSRASLGPIFIKLAR